MNTKLYTRQGDQGQTSLCSGQKISKDACRLEAYGNIDELNSFIGMARSLAETAPALAERLAKIQNTLFTIGSELAMPDGEAASQQLVEQEVIQLEVMIDEVDKDLTELKAFILPGGTQINAALHQCRTICRRTERSVVRLAQSEAVSPILVKYLNRLSDLFFALARQESQRSGVPEYTWKK